MCSWCCNITITKLWFCSVLPLVTRQKKKKHNKKVWSSCPQISRWNQSSPSSTACIKMTGSREECCYSMCWINAGNRQPPPPPGKKREGYQTVWSCCWQNPGTGNSFKKQQVISWLLKVFLSFLHPLIKLFWQDSRNQSYKHSQCLSIISSHVWVTGVNPVKTNRLTF